jgi:hypothetical protein
MSKSNVVNLAALLDVCVSSVEVAPGKTFTVRPLNLEEMVKLLISNQEAFFHMYAAAVEGQKNDVMNLAPVLMAAPEMAAMVIAIASDQEPLDEAAAAVQARMPAAVQLIALTEIFKLSVPDPKKTYALLSEVMGRLQGFAKSPAKEVLKMSSPETSSKP